jgi:hypothetical protein
MYKVLSFIVIMIMFTNMYSQINQVVFDTIAQKDILIGECNREGLQLPVFAEYYTMEYNSYNPDTAVIRKIKAKGSDYRIDIVMGSWCGDSKEQVPRFLKIADKCGFLEDDIRIICVDKKKSAPGFEYDLLQYGIQLIPTFIFLSGESEIGRITETPVESLETDWLKILEKL